ncbi:hypothetical protein ACP70R_022966 [Stipagrostis hirtigluma subsp. patula]
MVKLHLRVLAAVVALAATVSSCGGFVFHEATVDNIQLGFKNGSLTSVALVQFYLDQISRLNPLLHAVIEVNPDALAQASRADIERSSGQYPGGLHGIPVLIKDNIATHDQLNTTAGSLALLGSIVRRDAGVVSRLRRTGAVILGTTNPTEWSAWRSNYLPNGWSARGGQTKNPYVLSATSCGSSAGSGVAAATNMAAVTLGSDTSGSILCPSSWNSVVGIRPTVGLTSRSGVVPISPRQDTIGPICRTVSDVVHVLDAIVGYDELDAEATEAASKYIPPGGYRQFLRIDGLRGKRIGVPNAFFNANNLRLYGKHLQTMRQLGAIVINGLNIATNLRDLSNLERNVVMNAEFKLSLNAYLSDLEYSPVRSLAEVIAFNKAHPVQERLAAFGQATLIASQNTNGIGVRERAAIQRLNDMSTNGLEKLMKDHQLDAIVAPNADASSVLAVGGNPAIAVPAGYNNQGGPYGICFGGLKGYEPRLIEMAYAFEQATKVRRPPTFRR